MSCCIVTRLHVGASNSLPCQCVEFLHLFQQYAHVSGLLQLSLHALLHQRSAATFIKGSAAWRQSPFGEHCAAEAQLLLFNAVNLG